MAILFASAAFKGERNGRDLAAEGTVSFLNDGNSVSLLRSAVEVFVCAESMLAGSDSSITNKMQRIAPGGKISFPFSVQVSVAEAHESEQLQVYVAVLLEVGTDTSKHWFGATGEGLVPTDKPGALAVSFDV